MATTGQGAGKGKHAGKKDQPASGAPETRTARAAGSKSITAQRVDYVLHCYVNGYAGERLARKVAAAHAKEADTRQKYMENPTNPELPGLLWGMEDEPPALRTVERWLGKAKKQLELRGSTVQRMGDRLLGLQLARLDLAWQMATRTKRPASMVRVVEVTNDLFAFEGAIRPSLSALTATGARTGDEKREPLPDAKMTEESAITVLADMLTVARDRRARAFAAPTPAEQQAATDQMIAGDASN